MEVSNSLWRDDPWREDPYRDPALTSAHYTLFDVVCRISMGSIW